MSNKIEIIARWFWLSSPADGGAAAGFVSGDTGRWNAERFFAFSSPRYDDVHRGLWVAFPRRHWLATALD